MILPITFLLLASASSMSTTPTVSYMPKDRIVLVCPSTAKVRCGAPIDPAKTGEATATTDCPTSPDVIITYADADAPPTGCPADRFHVTILRTWTAVDACGDTASCTQELHILREIVELDIQPGTCPNSIDANSGASTVTMAIPGDAMQPVAQIDPSSVRVYVEQCSAGPVAPTLVSVADVAQPFRGAVCDCTSSAGDGIPDLVLDFDRAALVAGLRLGTVPDGSTVRLVVTGAFDNGCTFIAIDCVEITNGGEGCSHGYWKNHLSAWGPTGYNPTDDFDTVFGVNAFTPDRTLLQALQAGGGGIDNLGRQGVAALLNASHPGVDFPLTPEQVITLVHDAVANGTAGSVGQHLDTLVNLGCPLN
jgi:hypothetical protein